MKIKILAIVSLITVISNAQWGTDDVVSIGSGYTDQVWYSLANDEQGTETNSEWDLAFEISGFTSSIRVNHTNDIKVWAYPNGDTTNWSTLDTTGMAANWTQYYNSDTSWSYGALNGGIDFSNQFDMGWGVYNMTSHQVVGDSLFVIQLGDASYRKLWIEKLANGEYTFRYANLDNSNDVSESIVKSDFTDKNFGYYSIINGTELDREPNKNSWDLVFTQYGVYFPSFNHFTTSTGALQNVGVEVAVAYPVNDSSTYENFGGLPFSTSINTIGYSWKNLNMSTFTYEIVDSTVYFVKDKVGDYWKIVFTGFGGSATGDCEFTKKKISGASIDDFNENKTFSKIYPNPSASGTNYNLVLDVNETENLNVNIIDLSGRIISQQDLNVMPGLNTYNLQTPNKTGQYIIQLTGNKTQITHQLIVK